MAVFGDDDGRIVNLIPKLAPDAEFVDSKTCVECHEDVYTHWKKSDHANSMNHANAKNVLGDFNDVTFLHVGFDDILLLNDDEVKLLIDVIEQSSIIFDPHKEYLNNASYPNYRYNISGRKTIDRFEVGLSDLVTGTFDAKSGIVNLLRKNMSAETQKEFDAELQFQRNLKFQRPGDIAIAHDKIATILRGLITNGKIKTKCGTKFRMFRNNDKFKIDTDVGEFEIKFTLGIRPLQQYLVATGGGKLQVLPVAWDVNSKRWFHLYPKEQIPKGDQLHWTTPVQNWNRMCADCHTTNLQKKFNSKTKHYETTFSEINVGCNTCHGACGKHAAAARKHKLLANWNPKIPKEVISLENISGAETVKNCAFCHARRRLLQDKPKPPERKVADWFVPELIDANVYYADGQLLEEAFEYGSFIQSKMHSKGVGCVNCHEPHSLELKFQGNRLCTQCHSPSIYNTVKHHFHPNSQKPGTQCVECHFPQSTFMVVDPRRDHSIRKPNPALTAATGVPNACTLCHHDRKKGETLEWANENVERWYADKRKSAVGYSDFTPVAEHYALAILAGKRNDLTAIPNLIKIIQNKNNKEYRPAIRASAIVILGRILSGGDVGNVSDNVGKNVGKNISKDVGKDIDGKTSDDVNGGLADEILGVCVSSLSDDDVWVRLAATSTFEFFSGDLRVKYLAPLLSDPALAVRVEAARVLAGQANNFRNDNVKTIFENVKQEYINSQYVNSDQPAAYLNLAAFEYNLVSPKIEAVNRWFQKTAQGLPPNNARFIDTQKKTTAMICMLTEKTFELYKQSIDLDKDFFPSRINLAMLYNERGDGKAAENELREALRIEPNDGNTAYSLGLLLAELGKFDDAIKMLKKATENFEKTTATTTATTNPSTQIIIESATQKSIKNRAGYNLSLLLINMKRYQEAENELEKIIIAEPKNTTFLYALLVLHLQKNEKQKAKKIIEKLIKLEPQNPLWKNLENENLNDRF
ncbi:MAG: tetratricopeptide repeat protein [Planctomycetaceae bacterium]|jgi:tetratricopeptide (TPR) repeat protein|nr:tetratricopeptide repeat protein [Planctomycetaceae bacterium]